MRAQTVQQLQRNQRSTQDEEYNGSCYLFEYLMFLHVYVNIFLDVYMLNFVRFLHHSLALVHYVMRFGRAIDVSLVLAT